MLIKNANTNSAGALVANSADIFSTSRNTEINDKQNIITIIDTNINEYK